VGGKRHRGISIGMLLFLLVAGAGSAAEPNRPGETVKLELEGGETLRGILVSENAAEIVIDHDLLGRVTIPKTRLKKPPEPNPGLFGTSFMEGWRRRVSAGASGSEGRTKKIKLTSRLEADAEKKHYRGRFSGRYLYESEDKSKTDNKSNVSYLHDHLISDSRFFLTGSGIWETDETQSWNHRIKGTSGIGYEFFERERFQLRGRAGPGFTSRVGGGGNGSDVNAVANVQAVWKPIDGQEIRFSTTYSLNASDYPEFLLTSELDWTIELGFVKGLSFRLGADYEYDSIAKGDNNDLDYEGSLVYEF